MKERCLVTGVAGFIGSSLADRLIAEGYSVLGLDCFTDYYSRAIKEQNLAALQRAERFTFHEENLLTTDLSALLREVDYVFHQAGQAGVRRSWGSDFTAYTDNNIVATQRLLEAAHTVALKKFVFASSSSIYGNAPELPVKETTLPRPVSPYGVTKLAAEHLCGLYAQNFGIPTVSLRYFTVYGPRQRPDMAFHKFIRALLAGHEIVIHGDGEQSRDFTYISDIVQANLAAAHAPAEGRPGLVYNIGGGARVTVNTLIRLLEGITQKKARLVYQAEQYGDARHTFADCSAARADLGFDPEYSLEAGLRAQVEWLRGEEKAEQQ